MSNQIGRGNSIRGNKYKVPNYSVNTQAHYTPRGSTNNNTTPSAPDRTETTPNQTNSTAPNSNNNIPGRSAPGTTPRGGTGTNTGTTPRPSTGTTPAIPRTSTPMDVTIPGSGTMPTRPTTPTTPMNGTTPGSGTMPTRPGTPTTPMNGTTPGSGTMPTRPTTPTTQMNGTTPGFGTMPTRPTTPTTPMNGTTPGSGTMPTRPTTPTTPMNGTTPGSGTMPTTPTTPTTPMNGTTPGSGTMPTRPGAPLNGTTSGANNQSKSATPFIYGDLKPGIQNTSKMNTIAKQHIMTPNSQTNMLPRSQNGMMMPGNQNGMIPGRQNSTMVPGSHNSMMPDNNRQESDMPQMPMMPYGPYQGLPNMYCSCTPYSVPMGIPLIPLYGYDNSEDLDRDVKYMKQLYPRIAKAIQSEIEEECDKLEYDGSMMFDEYPDKVSIERIIDHIYDKVKNIEEEPQVEVNSLYLFPPRRQQNLLRDVINIILLNEIFNRRRRYRSRRRWY